MKPRTFLALPSSGPEWKEGERRFVFKVYTLSKLRQWQVDLLATKMWRERASQLGVDKPSARAKVLPISDRNDCFGCEGWSHRLQPIAERKS